MSNEHEPGNEVLFRDGELIVSSARVEQNGFSCAAKYISTVDYSANNPSKSHAWVGLFACAVAIVASMIYLYLGKLGVTVFVPLHLLVLIIASLIVYLYLLSPMTYSIDVSLVNGQNFRIKRTSEKTIREIFTAIKDAVALNRAAAESANWTIKEGSPAPVDVTPFLNHPPSGIKESAIQKTLPFSAGR